MSDTGKRGKPRASVRPGAILSRPGRGDVTLTDIGDVMHQEVVAGYKGPRSLALIASEIRKDWTKPYFGAVPYIGAMAQLDKVTDRYIAEDGKTIVLYFLSNATTWRGDVARRVKAELKALVKGS